MEGSVQVCSWAEVDLTFARKPIGRLHMLLSCCCTYLGEVPIEAIRVVCVNSVAFSGGSLAVWSW